MVRECVCEVVEKGRCKRQGRVGKCKRQGRVGRCERQGRVGRCERRGRVGKYERQGRLPGQACSDPPILRSSGGPPDLEPARSRREVSSSPMSTSSADVPVQGSSVARRRSLRGMGTATPTGMPCLPVCRVYRYAVPSPSTEPTSADIYRCVPAGGCRWLL
eukprot:6340339-Prymnesium_polylepis.1